MRHCKQCKYFNGENYCGLHKFVVNPDDPICSFMKTKTDKESFLEEEELPLAEEQEGGISIEY